MNDFTVDFLRVLPMCHDPLLACPANTFRRCPRARRCLPIALTSRAILLLLLLAVVPLRAGELVPEPATEQPPDPRDFSLRWDADTRVLVARGGSYGRMVRLPDGRLLCAFVRGSEIWTCTSRDQGRKFGPARRAVQFERGAATNPELIVLTDGRLLMAYNQRPREAALPYTIRTCLSDDAGRTWRHDTLAYRGGTTWSTGCWEPAPIELPSGKIQMFFANEAPYPNSQQQEISVVSSTDGGRSWTGAETVSFRPRHRDGMPVPLLLSDGRTIAVAIEDNGFHGKMKPVIITGTLQAGWGQPPVGADSPHRRGALQHPLPEQVYAGAPYLRQLACGLTVLSVQSDQGRSQPAMVVYLGDAQAAGFTSRSEPFRVPPDTPGLWNSLFVKGPRTVTALSGTSLDGVRGLWAIDGHLVARRPSLPPDAPPEKRAE